MISYLLLHLYLLFKYVIFITICTFFYRELIYQFTPTTCKLVDNVLSPEYGELYHVYV